MVEILKSVMSLIIFKCVVRLKKRIEISVDDEPYLFLFVSTVKVIRIYFNEMENIR